MINSNDVVPYVVNGGAMNSFSQFLHTSFSIIGKSGSRSYTYTNRLPHGRLPPILQVFSYLKHRCVKFITDVIGSGSRDDSEGILCLNSRGLARGEAGRPNRSGNPR